MMTKLQSLKSRLKELPTTEKRKRLLGVMGQYHLKLTEAEEQLNSAGVQEESVNSVFGDGSVAVVTSERKKAARIAKKLAAKLREDIEAVNNPRAKVNESVTILGEIGTASVRDVRNGWHRLIDQKLKPYEKLVDVARKLHLEGAEDLAAVMQQLRSVREQIPSNAQRAANVAKSLRDLPAAVQKLGFEDATVQKFVEDAADGRAKLKVFSENAAIGAFIQRHKLWDLFRVSTN
jgi:hypothetical protein